MCQVANLSVFRQYLFIPVLPHCLQDMLQAPMPFLIGVPKQVVNTNVSDCYCLLILFLPGFKICHGELAI